MQNESRIRFEFSSHFDKRLRQLSAGIVIAFKQTQDLFRENPNHTFLRRHALKEKYKGYESIDITDDYRALFREIKTEKETVIKFYYIGTHKELYG